MKLKNLFFKVLFTIIILLIICVFINTKEYFISTQMNLNQTNNNGITYETIPIKKSVIEAQKEINLILTQQPIKFKNNSFLLEDNRTINKIISILNATIGDIAILVVSHSNSNKSRSFNRKLTQKRADIIASYIKEKYHVKFINAIGYGKEFPLSKENNSTNNRIKIYLKRIYNDF